MRFLSIAILLMIIPKAALAENHCYYHRGIERWRIKTTMLNPEARAIRLPLASLLSARNPRLSRTMLRQMQSEILTHTFEFKSQGKTIALNEGQKLLIHGRILSMSCEADGDIHLSVYAGDRAKCIIIEVPSPGQIHEPGLKRLVENARQKAFQFLANGIPNHRLTFERQLFIDTDHLTRAQMGKVGTPKAGGHRGRHACAVNVWEIHPVTLIE
jgi:hypothetical protein